MTEKSGQVSHYAQKKKRKKQKAESILNFCDEYVFDGSFANIIKAMCVCLVVG